MGFMRIHIKIEQALVALVDKAVKRINLKTKGIYTRSHFIRDAIKEKLEKRGK
jgi:metal-responsive CopG/Arc/MetJ family transcriptional regulator